MDSMQGFFQRFWLIVGNSVKEEVKHIFSIAKIPRYLKETLITLIPKCKCPGSINNFQPISLCNYIYKVMTKVIVARIRPLLNGIISPFQSVFMSGRKGTDNAIIVQELIHSMARKRGNSGVMAIKIDLECLWSSWMEFYKRYVGLIQIPKTSNLSYHELHVFLFHLGAF